MYRGLIFTLILLCLIPWADDLNAQNPVISGDGIEVIVPKKTDRKLNSYFILTGGYQNQYMVTVPMIPENTPSENFVIGDDLTTLVDGYSFGLGVFNKTKSFLDVGLMADYYSNSTAIAKTGERSMGPWVLDQSNGESNLTDPFDMDHHRVCEVYVVRASVRLKLPLGPVNIWAGISGGTYTSTVRYTEREEVTFFNSASKTLIAPSYQTGLDVIFRNQKKEDILSITLFADFSSPKMEESFFDTVISGWDFAVPDGNNVISPVRFGLAIGIH